MSTNRCQHFSHKLQVLRNTKVCNYTILVNLLKFWPCARHMLGCPYVSLSGWHGFEEKSKETCTCFWVWVGAYNNKDIRRNNTINRPYSAIHQGCCWQREWHTFHTLVLHHGCLCITHLILYIRQTTFSCCLSFTSQCMYQILILLYLLHIRMRVRDPCDCGNPKLTFVSNPLRVEIQWEAKTKWWSRHQWSLAYW